MRGSVVAIMNATAKEDDCGAGDAAKPREEAKSCQPGADRVGSRRDGPAAANCDLQRI